MTQEPLHTHDMYGNEIYRLGETGYGVSMTIHAIGIDSEQPWLPFFTVFHCSDGFRQSLFSVSLERDDRAQLSNLFTDRIRDLIESHPHGTVHR